MNAGTSETHPLGSNAAEIILKQLGGDKFLTMTGASLWTPSETELTIKLPSLSKVSCVVVTLAEGSDTYTVQAYKGRGISIRKQGKEIRDVHASELRGFFRHLTGLEVSL